MNKLIKYLLPLMSLDRENCELSFHTNVIDFVSDVQKDAWKYHSLGIVIRTFAVRW